MPRWILKLAPMSSQISSAPFPKFHILIMPPNIASYGEQLSAAPRLISS